MGKELISKVRSESVIMPVYNKSDRLSFENRMGSISMGAASTLRLSTDLYRLSGARKGRTRENKVGFRPVIIWSERQTVEKRHFFIVFPDANLSQVCVIRVLFISRFVVQMIMEMVLFSCENSGLAFIRTRK